MLPAGYAALGILVVDDIAHTRQMLRGILRHLGFRRVSEAASAHEALAIIKAMPPDLVFTDWNMPGGSGHDLIRAIRTDPDMPDPTVPIILLTAHGHPEYVKAGRDAGATDFLVKPFAPARIRERILDVVARPRGFVVTPTYRGPDRRRHERPVVEDRRTPMAPGANLHLLPPDPVLMAKVSGDDTALHQALRQRAEGFRRLSRVQEITKADAEEELGRLIEQALSALDLCAAALAHMAAPLGVFRATMSGKEPPSTLRVIASLQRLIAEPTTTMVDPGLIRLHLLALQAMLHARADPTAERTATELANQIEALASHPRPPFDGGAGP